MTDFRYLQLNDPKFYSEQVLVENEKLKKSNYFLIGSVLICMVVVTVLLVHLENEKKEDKVFNPTP